MSEDQIYDIYGLNKVSWFPPGIGYFYVLATALLLVGLYVFIKKHRGKRLVSWQYQAKQELRQIEKQDKIDLVTLHDFIKKLAINKFERSNVAKLSGSELLKFLEKNDPHNFSWTSSAKFMNRIYRKEKEQLKLTDIKDITSNIKKWI